jgi:hypothetical protein
MPKKADRSKSATNGKKKSPTQADSQVGSKPPRAPAARRPGATSAGKRAAATKAADVDAFVAVCGHPLVAVLDAVRAIVRHTAPMAVEGIKWNAPSFAVGGDDRITCNLSAKDRVRLVFHCGAKKRATGNGRVLANDEGLLEWAADDRGIATFRSVAEVAAAKPALARLVRAWLAATVDLERAEVEVRVRRGLRDVQKGRTMDLAEFERRLRERLAPPQ